jgi:hypothetical protein
VPSRRETIELAVSIFDQAVRRYGGGPGVAWLGMCEALLWYEKTGLPAHPSLPHIIDADKLRRPASRARGGESAARPTVWQGRAAALEAYLALQMKCDAPAVRGSVDRLLRRREYRGLQRQNPLGTGFVGLVHHALSRYGSQHLVYELEMPAQEVFPGITFPGRSKAPAVDALVRKGRVPRAIVSVKWSLRHDRINDLTNECPAYKQAASWGRHPLEYIVVTHEYDPARLEKVLSDACIDAVVHVHKPAVVEVSGLDGRLRRPLDLTELFGRTGTL